MYGVERAAVFWYIKDKAAQLVVFAWRCPESMKSSEIQFPKILSYFIYARPANPAAREYTFSKRIFSRANLEQKRVASLGYTYALICLAAIASWMTRMTFGSRVLKHQRVNCGVQSKQNKIYLYTRSRLSQFRPNSALSLQPRTRAAGNRVFREWICLWSSVFQEGMTAVHLSPPFCSLEDAENRWWWGFTRFGTTPIVAGKGQAWNSRGSVEST